MDGVIYLLDQAGRALAEANQQIANLTKQVEELTNNDKGNTHGSQIR